MESPIIAKLPRGHRMDRQFGIVYDAAPAEADDLTQIDGIRTREAVLLNQRGIYLFGQIALWRHREIVEIAGELQIPVARIVDEGWMEQARSLSHPVPSGSAYDLPASAFRTISLLVCALLVGVFTIYMLGRHRNQPLTGVLSADITSIRVPAPSRLTAVHVKAGQEVFSGQPLLTLEKLEHLSMLEAQERTVRKLTQDLKRAEAQAKIEAEWRTSELDRELTDVQSPDCSTQNATAVSACSYCRCLKRPSRDSCFPSIRSSNIGITASKSTCRRSDVFQRQRPGHRQLRSLRRCSRSPCEPPWLLVKVLCLILRH
ncbi:MAG: hypothetical protein U0936_04175 [Planctomycetaceae bacterium]